MSKQTHLFATRGDFSSGLTLLEAQRPLKYVLLELYKSPEFQSYTSLLQLDDLGVDRTGDRSRGKQYLVLDASKEVTVRGVPQRKGGVNYFVNIEPTSIVFSPGGLYESCCLIAANIGTASTDPASIQLYKEFTRTITKGFKKLGNYYVGAEALKLLDSGVRLITMDVKEAPEYDLKRSK